MIYTEGTLKGVKLKDIKSIEIGGTGIESPTVMLDIKLKGDSEPKCYELDIARHFGSLAPLLALCELDEAEKADAERIPGELGKAAAA